MPDWLFFLQFARSIAGANIMPRKEVFVFETLTVQILRIVEVWRWGSPARDEIEVEVVIQIQVASKQ